MLYKLWTQDQTNMKMAETGTVHKSEEVELATGRRSRASFYCHWFTTCVLKKVISNLTVGTWMSPQSHGIWNTSKKNSVVLALWVRLFVIERAGWSFTHVKTILAGHENVPKYVLSQGSPDQTQQGAPMQQVPVFRSTARTSPLLYQPTPIAFKRHQETWETSRFRNQLLQNLLEKTS